MLFHSIKKPPRIKVNFIRGKPSKLKTLVLLKMPVKIDHGVDVITGLS